MTDHTPTTAGWRDIETVWCVKHRGGWCAADPNRSWPEEKPIVNTKCGCSVVFPYGCEKRHPTCGECAEILARKRARSLIPESNNGGEG